jgi:GT2 family glycosyltransferase
MFASTIMHNLGTNPNEFNLEEFNNVTKKYNKYGATCDGSTFPFFMSKKMYMACGGWDIQYPGPHIVDWDFFLKLELLGMKFRRIHDCNFYHFVAQSTKLNVNTNTVIDYNMRENMSAKYFEHKWGFPPRNFKDNLKSPIGDIYRGIRF